MAPCLSRSATYAAPIGTGAVPYALLRTTRTFDPPMLVRTICRSVWFVKCTYGGGEKTWSGGGVTGRVAGAGHLALTMKGASGGAVGGTGVCGRPTSAVVQVPTQRSARLLCANELRTLHRRTNANASRSVFDLIALLLVPHTG